MHTPEDLSLRTALCEMLRHPLGLARDWNWKAAAVSALLRAGIFFASSLRSGGASALKAMLVEAAYATVAAGIAGAVTQRLRHATPRRATALVVWFALPLPLLAAEFAVHRALGTPHLARGIIASFVFAACSSGFNWFAMAHGAFVTGQDRSFLRDLRLVPPLLVQFVAWPVRAVLQRKTPPV